MQFQSDWFLKGIMSFVFLYHGLTKNLNNFAEGFGFSTLIAALVIFAEVAGGLGYLLGMVNEDTYYGYSLTQWASLAVIPVMLGAIYLVHGKNGFNVMNNGYEYQLTLLMVALYLFSST